MKKCIALLALTVGMLPAIAQGQGFQRQQHKKDVSMARGTAINNTIFPVLTGLGAVYLINNKTIRTTGAALAVYGLIMGPSSGNFYAEDYLRGGLGVVSRLGSGYLLVDATRELLGEKMADSVGWDSKEVSLTDTKVLVGAGVFLGSMIFNVISAKASVDEYNQSLGYSVHVRPADLGERTVPVLTASVRF